MTLLPEISADQLRCVQDMETLCSNSGEQAKQLYQSLPVLSDAISTTLRIANKICPENYNSNIPDSRQQAALSTIFDLQQCLMVFTGYPSVSLAALNCRMAIFSSLSMTINYHLKKRQQRNYIVLIKGLDDVAHVANELNLRVIFSDLENISDLLNEECVAVVISLPGIDANIECLESLRGKLEQLDIPLYIDGSRQYLLAQNIPYEWLKADILHLDVGYICGLGKGGNAVLSNSKYADYLPLPMVGNNDEAYQWKTLSDSPLSIGMLSDTPVDLQVVLHCLIYFRMQGFAAIQQQAIQSMLMASYIAQQINQAGIKTEGVSGAGGCCVVVIRNEMASSESIDQLLDSLSELPIRLQIQCQNNYLKITLANLHQLNFDQLHLLIEMFILQH
jgi:glycine cleavage system protein P-like pyridoxal-binding family